MRNLFSSWNNTLSKLGKKGRKKRQGQKRLFAKRPKFEMLEERRLLAITVNTAIDEMDGSINDGDISLRDAIAAAVSGDTIDFAGSLNNQTILLDRLGLGQIDIAKSLAIDASMLSSLTIDADDPTAGRTADGIRIFNISNPTGNVVVEFIGLTLQGTDVDGDGGAIKSEAPLVIRDSIIRQNEARDGGGIFVKVAGNGTSREVLRIENSTIDSNDAQTGAGIFVESGTSSVATTDTIVITNSTVITNNKATGNGGGVYAELFGASLTIDDSSTINLNQASRGGGIYADFDDGASLSLVDVTLEENDASSQGAGLYAKLDQQSTARVETVTFRDNEASSQGGGLYADMDNSSTLDVFLSTFDINDGSQGAGLYADVNSQSQLMVDQSTFDANEATSQGGGMYTRISNSATATIADSLFQLNDANSNGGGIYGQVNSGANFTVSDGRLLQNDASSGGGIYLNLSDASASITDSLIENNTASGQGFGAGGGGIHSTSSQGASLLIEDSEISQNEAFADGGGIFALSNGISSNPFRTPRAFTLSRSLVTGNLTRNRGGGLYTKNFEGTETRVEDSRITGNKADSGNAGNGGGIYAYLWDNSMGVNKPRFIISQSTVDNNDARDEGGGIFVCGKFFGEFVAVNTTVSGNETLDTANGMGGGIFIARFGTPSQQNESIDAYLRNITVTQNISNTGGGVVSSDLDNVRTTITNSIISENRDHQQQPSNLVGRLNIANTRYNLVGTGSTILDLSGQAATLDGTNISNDTPMLSPLGFFGGLTPTHRPLTGSPVIDEGDPSAVAGVADIPEFDQRGANFTRVVDAPGVNDSDGLRIDIGAVELRPAPYVLNVLFSNGTDTFDFAASGNIGSGRQVMQLPYEGLNTVTIEFSEPVDLPPAAVSANRGLRLLGAYGTIYALSTPTGNGTQTVTWQLASGSLPNIEMVLLELSDDITDLSVNALDGEWVNPKSTTTINESVSEFPSGDGIAGGDFQFAFVTHIPGDFNGDNYVGNADLTLLSDFWGQLHDPNSNWITDLPTDFVGNDELTRLLDNWGEGWQDFVFLLMGDADGDYVVGNADLTALLDHWGQSMVTRSEGDLTGDGSVGNSDLTAFLDTWGLQVQFVD